ncbi:rhomboid-like protein 20 [Zingiber officinale]|uniref:rhomboid-like protein 20 n=1 Tax=Zingiber officinale TaxID=94328 RepID=UPI001C4B6B6E|nr:rhomboid-like protein 20 [Zingiber officinale]
MNGGPSGFHNAPVTKTIVVVSAFLTVLAGIQGRSLRLGLSYQDIFGKFPLWKLIASTFAFSSTPEMIFGLYLLYYFRVFERQIGSNKHTIFIIFSILLSLILEALALAYLKETLSKLASGPYGLIFAAFLPFYFDIPVSSRFRVFGLNFTDKSLIYLAGLQLLFSSWKRSIVPGLCGLLAGSLYRLNVLGIRKLKFPEAFLSVFSRLPLPSSGSSPILARGNATGNMRPYPGHQMEEGGYPSQLERNHSDSTEASIATLVSMGFDRDSARRALTHAENDVNVATNILLESQSLR